MCNVQKRIEIKVNEIVTNALDSVPPNRAKHERRVKHFVSFLSPRDRPINDSVVSVSMCDVCIVRHQNLARRKNEEKLSIMQRVPAKGKAQNRK